MKNTTKRIFVLAVAVMVMLLLPTNVGAQVTPQLNYTVKHVEDYGQSHKAGWLMTFSFSNAPAAAVEHYMWLTIWREKDIFHRRNPDPDASMMTRNVVFDAMEQMWFTVGDKPEDCGYPSDDPDDKDCKLELEWNGWGTYVVMLSDELFMNMPVPENVDDVADLPVYYYIGFEIKSAFSNRMVEHSSEKAMPTLLTYMYQWDGEIGEGDEGCPPHDWVKQSKVDAFNDKSYPLGGGSNYPQELSYKLGDDCDVVLRHVNDGLYISKTAVTVDQVCTILGMEKGKFTNDNPFKFANLDNAQTLMQKMVMNETEKKLNAEFAVAMASREELITAEICTKEDFAELLKLEQEAQDNAEKEDELRYAMEEDVLTPDGHLYLTAYGSMKDSPVKTHGLFTVGVTYFEKCSKCDEEKKNGGWSHMFHSEKQAKKFVDWLEKKNAKAWDDALKARQANQ